MESRPQNPEFRNNSENFHPCFWSESRSASIDWALSRLQKHSLFCLI